VENKRRVEVRARIVLLDRSCRHQTLAVNLICTRGTHQPATDRAARVGPARRWHAGGQADVG